VRSYALKVTATSDAVRCDDTQNEIRIYEFIRERFSWEARSGIGEMFVSHETADFIFILLVHYRHSLASLLRKRGAGLPLTLVAGDTPHAKELFKDLVAGVLRYEASERTKMVDIPDHAFVRVRLPGAA
jgi:hypothetical protein